MTAFKIMQLCHLFFTSRLRNEFRLQFRIKKSSILVNNRLHKFQIHLINFKALDICMF